VRAHLSNLDAHKFMGPDGMHPQLSIILERSRRTGEVPEDWTKANVTPVLKKGKKEDLGNYRSDLHPGKDEGTSHSRRHHQASGGKEGYQD